MTYDSKSELPESVRGTLPEDAQKIYREAFNSAWEQYDDADDREKRAHQVAWSAVKEEYEKNEEGEWVKKEGGD